MQIADKCGYRVMVIHAGRPRRYSSRFRRGLRVAASLSREAGGQLGRDLRGRGGAAEVARAGPSPPARPRSRSMQRRRPPSCSPRCSSIMRAGPDRADRVGDPLARDVGRRAVHGLEHRREARARGSGWPTGAMPIEPATAAARSERMSPNRLEATITSNQSRVEHELAARASMWYLLGLDSGCSAPRPRSARPRTACVDDPVGLRGRA